MKLTKAIHSDISELVKLLKTLFEQEALYSLGIKNPSPFRVEWQEWIKLQKDNKVFLRDEICA